jgi:predicted restriction endonuclease
MREKFLEYLSKVDRQMPEERREQIIDFAEIHLTDFLRKFIDPEFSDIYACTDRKFYVDAENQMQTNLKMRSITEKDDLFALSIYHYKNFLGSKIFKGEERLYVAPKIKDTKTDASISVAIQTAADPLLPEAPDETTEGKSRQVSITTYERNPQDRKKVLERDNYVCQVCQMNFQAVYGEIGKEYIEVHHLYPVCNMGEDYHFDPLDPEKGLVCLCSNCHAMIHRGGRYEVRDGQRVMIPMALSELQKLYTKLNQID